MLIKTSIARLDIGVSLRRTGARRPNGFPVGCTGLFGGGAQGGNELGISSTICT